MAAVATTQTVKVTINDVEIDVPKGELVVEAVKRLGLEIPVFCYHPRLKPVGMCRMCLVEVGFKQPDGSVRKMPKPQAGCTLPVSEGMAIYTDSEAVRRDRRGVLEFLLVNHPLDCPICDRGGECPLQNNVLAYGPGNTRFTEPKRHAHKAYRLSKHVTLDLERCIQCGRCVRFTEEISGDHQLAFRYRGAHMQPSTFQLSDFESRFSGNVIEICPVGALTSSDYRFRARPWDLEARPGICTLTPCGTNVWLDQRAGSLVRVNGRTNEEVNEEWTCDATKFGYDFLNSPDRVKACNVREGDGFRPATWGEAVRILIDRFAGKGEEAAVIVKADNSNEALHLLARVAKEVLVTTKIDHRMEAAPPAKAARAKYGVWTTLQEIELAPAVFVLGANLAEEQPMTFLRMRKGWFQRGSRVVTCTGEPTEADSFASEILRYKKGGIAGAAKALAAAMGVPGYKDDGASGLGSAALKSAAAHLSQPGAVFLTTHGLHCCPGCAEAVEVVAQMAAHVGGRHTHLPSEANSAGAALLGAVGESTDTRQVLQDAADGKVKSLWLAGADPVADFPDRELAERALEAVDFLVVQSVVANQSTPYASLVLPLAAPAEQSGTYTSSELRVQRMEQALQPPGEARPLWKVCAEVLSRAGEHPHGYFTTQDVLAEIVQKVPEFRCVSEAGLSGTGCLLSRGPSSGS